MFYFDELNGYKILRSDYLKDIDAFFTTRECPIPEKGENDTYETDELVFKIEEYDDKTISKVKVNR